MMRKLFVGILSTAMVLAFAAASDSAFAARKGKKKAVAGPPACAALQHASCTTRGKGGACAAWTCVPFFIPPSR